ncbi:uncharacterized protein V1516DRAFT_663643 [Lipomyces oligophaga]|uniref:uncharacterized protein n=1 Tax=Lipomyces oligophaga TaxID=45792 RepID=UPI0034CDB82C
MTSLLFFAAFIALASGANAQGTEVLTNLPVYNTPFTYADPSYEVSPKKTDFTVSKVATWGSLTDWKSKHNSSAFHITEYGTPVSFCPIGNHSFWVTGDVEVDNTPATMQLFWYYPSYLSVGMSPLHTTNVVSAMDQWLPYNGSDVSFVAWTDAQFSSYTNPFEQPLTACVPINSTTSIQVWNSYLNLNTEALGLPSFSQGSYLVKYTLSDDGKTLTTDRPQKFVNELDTTFTEAGDNGVDLTITGQYLWGKFAAMKVEDYIYLYALDVSVYSNSTDLMVARAPVDDVMDSSSWSYYSASTDTWLTTAPTATESRKDTLAIYSLPSDIKFAAGTENNAGGSVFYSEYHDAYLMIFVASDDTTKYIIEYAPSPVGPWSTDRHVLYTDAYHDITSSIFSVYAFSTPLIGTAQGKELLISTKSKNSVANAIVQKLIFE